jgi:hypothetical protein
MRRNVLGFASCMEVLAVGWSRPARFGSVLGNSHGCTIGAAADFETVDCRAADGPHRSDNSGALRCGDRDETTLCLPSVCQATADR